MNDASINKIVRNRRRRGAGFTAAEDQVIAQLWYEGVVPDSIAARLRRTAPGVRARARKLGLPPIKAIQCMTAKERSVVPARPTTYWEAFLTNWRKEYREHIKTFVQTGIVGKGPGWLHDVRKS